MGADVTIIEASDHLLSREPQPLGDALAERFASEGIELRFGEHVSSARREDGDYVLVCEGGVELRGDRLLVATGRRARVQDLGLESVGVELQNGRIEVDSRLRVADGVWAIGDATGIWPLTYVGKYQGRIVAANIQGQNREANYDAVPRVVFTDPQAASVGEAEGPISVTTQLGGVARTSTYTREYEDAGFMTLVSDGERITGAYALGPEAGEWLQQATLAIRAKVPLEVMHDTIQPFPTFSEAFLHALLELQAKVPATA
jgi:pyruvate/2-oxoglutarate dehydrogenase complex dihydrolipoamide dehydrogenase (E3) component